MELRSEKSKLLNKRRESYELFNDEAPAPAITPIRPSTNIRSEDEDSPYFSCSTQEMREDVDVLWDYNSPQSRAKSGSNIIKKSKKRLNLQASPKVPFRRHPSNNNEQIKQDFCKLREELRALKAEIAKPDHEESLILSPREEETFKITQYQVVDEPFDTEEEFEDPFNDDMDDKLIMFSQQVERDLPCDKNLLQQDKSEVFNDSFNNLLSQMNHEDFDQLTQVVDIKQYKTIQGANKDVCNKVKGFPRSMSEDQVNVNNGTNKVQWHRTASFESYTNAQIPQEKLLEIERKRLEAKAKLEAKKRQEVLGTIVEHTDSPLKCSPEEIEKKRLQALAKLEAKRQQEIIERKKQEALKRREQNRRKQASQVKSSLSARL